VNDVARDLWLEETARRAGHADLLAFREKHGLKGYRLDQIYRAANKEFLAGPAEATVLPADLRERLVEERFSFSAIEPVTVRRSSDRQTTKGLFRLQDGAEVESVLMEHYGDRNTVCISSQAGCAFGCTFCSTGQAGFTRHLTATEIFSQARYFACLLARSGRRISNVVFMGMGEPFHNYEAVMRAVRLLNDPHGLGLGHRHITISTVGVVPKIDALAKEEVQVNLAISLHASTDDERSLIMPVNRKYPIAELMAACERYVAATKRKVFFEYIMLEGFNDSPEAATRLAGLMRSRLYHVNLIPYNATPGAPYRGSGAEAIRRFADLLEAARVPTTVRHPMGRDIAAACGQLRAQTQPGARALAS
jgi:23S rRNA (adenine2503-C2)-methyltransferase